MHLCQWLILALLPLLVSAQLNTSLALTPCASQPPPSDSLAAQLKGLVTSVENISVKVRGSVLLENACTFAVLDFTYFYSLPQTYWYGGNDTDPDSYAVKVSDTPVGSFSENARVPFTLLPGVTFHNFTVLKLYSETFKQIVAVAQVRRSSALPPSAHSNSKSLTNTSGAERGPRRTLATIFIMSHLVLLSILFV
ncbi:uncharacterized protein VTP21DRAFT_10177 [Calcarisporiella thermophila]|uniref:uncharacterized protein n=1 Tax=Calcarisporiella thermophila TaxID=911321 RepID=UPI003743FF86